MLRLNIIPRERRFFDLLHRSASNIHAVAQKLVDLMENYRDVEHKVREIKALEEAGDEIIHEIMKSLHRTFVTPIDREDIALLAERLDDVVDSIEEAARNMWEYQIEKPTNKAWEMAQIILMQGKALEEAVTLLRYRGSRLNDILPYTVELNRLENEADQVTSRAIGELFNNGYTPIEVIKWKEIYFALETAADKCEDAANVLEAIVLKNS
ncbi:MAG: DUF47 domain-containing protein [Chloroflexi bacterium]|nr:DUF47 domain-containing protein [Chloroflexota bacterium]